MIENLSKAPKANSRVENLHEAILEQKKGNEKIIKNPWVKTSWRHSRQEVAHLTSGKKKKKEKKREKKQK